MFWLPNPASPNNYKHIASSPDVISPSCRPPEKACFSNGSRGALPGSELLCSNCTREPHCNLLLVNELTQGTYRYHPTEHSEIPKKTPISLNFFVVFFSPPSPLHSIICIKRATFHFWSHGHKIQSPFQKKAHSTLSPQRRHCKVVIFPQKNDVYLMHFKQMQMASTIGRARTSRPETKTHRALEGN